jgi:hypothetical protein
MLYGVIVAATAITPLPLLRGSLRHLHRTNARIPEVVLNHADISSTSTDYAEYYGGGQERYYEESSVTS